MKREQSELASFLFNSANCFTEFTAENQDLLNCAAALPSFHRLLCQAQLYHKHKQKKMLSITLCTHLFSTCKQSKWHITVSAVPKQSTKTRHGDVSAFSDYGPGEGKKALWQQIRQSPSFNGVCSEGKLIFNSQDSEWILQTCLGSVPSCNTAYEWETQSNWASSFLLQTENNPSPCRDARPKCLQVFLLQSSSVQLLIY